MTQKITFLGMGAMGVRMAKHLLQAGYPLTVWNRTASACDELVAWGAVAAPTPMDAVADADVVISMVRDNEASRDVWLNAQTGAFFGMKENPIAIESSTLTVDWIQSLANMFAVEERLFLEAPVSGSRPQAEAAELVFLMGGEQSTFERVRNVLKCMGKVPDNVIGKVGSGALAKLCTNTLMGVQVVVLAEMIAMLQRNHANVDNTLAALAQTPAWSMIATRNTPSMLNGHFAPLFPVELIEKDMRYMLDSVGENQMSPVIRATQQVFQQGVEHGFGAEQMTAVIKLFQK